MEIVLLKLVSDLAMRMTSPHGDLEISPFLFLGEAVDWQSKRGAAINILGS